MAPEILKMKEEENKKYNDKCDLWSIGIIIYELYFKRSPYNGENANAILKFINNLGQKILKKTGYNQLDDLIQKLLISDPIKRISWDEYFNHSFFKDEIKVIYKTEGKKKIKILGKQFVLNNKNICYIKYKNKEYELTEYFDIEEEIENLEIKIKGIKRINDISYMFHKCSSLLSLEDISNWITNDINNMNSMFYECSSLKYLPDISHWDTSKVANMSNLFTKCSSLLSLPDISKWNISNVNNINNIFNECISLKSIPNIFNMYKN